MRKSAVLPAWGRILRGYRPFLSIEITRECPLRCPGCYAYTPAHLGNGSALRAVSDLRGDALVAKVLEAVRRYRPLHVSMVGGEPLIRHRELSNIIPQLNAMGIEVQVVTSAFRPIPASWAAFDDLHLVVSVDGLQPDHDARRTPATYERILDNIEGHQVIVHCTVTPQSLLRPDDLEQFARFWSGRDCVRKIWFSLFTPQVGDYPAERLSATERTTAIDRIAELPRLYPKVDAPPILIEGYRNPPPSPAECIFAQTTTCVSPDLSTLVLPCQVGGQPECSECGCVAGAGLVAVGMCKIAGLVRLSDIFSVSKRMGDRLRAALDS